MQILPDVPLLAQRAVEACRLIATFTDKPGNTTRTFLSPVTREVHRFLREWMERLGMAVSLDAVGNLRGSLIGSGPPLIMGSHIDTVPDAGVFDGVLGVVLALSVIEALQGETGNALEVIAFSEEEGVRFKLPCIGSSAVVEGLDPSVLAAKDAEGVTVEQAIRAFGLDPAELGKARIHDARAYFEFHIEQGPVLESKGLRLGIVTEIAGQTRMEIIFRGEARHAGTTPMNLRKDALAGAAEWVLQVEAAARSVEGAVATVGSIRVAPYAGNVIAGEAILSLDVRHPADDFRRILVKDLIKIAGDIAQRRNLTVTSKTLTDQKSVAMDSSLRVRLEQALIANGTTPFHLPSGAGHDAMIMAKRFPSAMLFLRSPGGISHHPDEDVLVEDVEAAIRVGRHFVSSFTKE